MRRNVRGLLFTVQKLLPLMKTGGSILLNVSVAGSSGFAGLSVYNATKAAVRSFARTWTSDLKGSGIRVNAISPGPIDTEGFVAVAPTPEAAAEMKAGFATAVPLGRIGTPDEVANVALFLASDESSFVTGAEYFVDGGIAQV
jgi:NAD(P)-dependent dehydrogenase (short-subunit alcohol dehydrogenase family)